MPVSWSRSGGPALRCTISCHCLGVEVVPQHEDVRFVAGVLVSKWCPSTKMYVLLLVSSSAICCLRLGLEVVPQHQDVRFLAGVLVWKWCPSTKMHDLLLVSWFGSGAPAPKWTICCQCLGLEVVPQHEYERFVAGVLVSKWLRCTICGAPARRCTTCCRCLGLEVVPQHKSVRFDAGILVSKSPSTKMYVLLPVLVTKWCPSTNMNDLLPVSQSRSGASAQKYTICCQYLGLEVVPSTRMYDMLPVSWSVAGVLVSKWWPSTRMYDLLPVSWSRSDAPALICTICCRCLGLEVVPQQCTICYLCLGFEVVAGVLVSK